MDASRGKDGGLLFDVDHSVLGIYDNCNPQETLSTLNLGAPGSELSERNKRTIGILRQLFPTLTQVIHNKALTNFKSQ